jgi:anaerobic selenocysteine-containing dehydrogenase
MVSRRMHNFYNSGGQQLDRLKKEFSYNPAFMNPEELAELGFRSGEIVEISGADGSIRGIVEPDPDVRRGVVSMAHAWGGAPADDDKLRTIGSNTGRLSSNAGRLDPRSGQPLMSAIPVNLTKVAEA